VPNRLQQRKRRSGRQNEACRCAKQRAGSAGVATGFSPGRRCGELFLSGAAAAGAAAGGPEYRGRAAQAAAASGSLKSAPFLDSWIRIDAKGSITVFTGKAELGQGIKTALVQIVAEELPIGVMRINLITADTASTPNEGYTAGSHSMQDSGTAIRHAAAQAREILIDQAAARFDMPAERLSAKGGSVVSDSGRSLSYGELVSGQLLHVQAKPDSKLKDPKSYTSSANRSRVDIPGKVTGAPELRAGSAAARHGAWPRGSSAQLRRAAGLFRQLEIEKCPAC
jgi:CO/xanthine dehydrogenase Mo-binding subunit